MSFIDSPPWLLAIGALLMVLAVVVLPVLYVRRWKHPKGNTMEWNSDDVMSAVLTDTKPRNKSRHSVAVLMALVMAALAVVVMRPTFTMPFADHRASVMLCIDSSYSMTAEKRMKEAVKEASAEIKQADPSLNIGLCRFDKEARVLVPPTTDRTAVLAALKKIKPKPGGTATGEAVFAATTSLDSFAYQGGSPKSFSATIVVLSDGREVKADGQRSLNKATAELLKFPEGFVKTDDQKARYEFVGIAYGSNALRVTLANGQACTVECQPDPEALQKAADATGGQAFTATNGQQFAEILRKVNEQAVTYNSSVWTPAAFALLALLVYLVLAGLFIYAFLAKKETLHTVKSSN